MKLQELFEKLSRVPQRETGNKGMTAKDVVKAILGDRAVFDSDAERMEMDGTLTDNHIVVGRSWTSMRAMFSTMDTPPGSGGAIGLHNINGKTPSDIAEAAHESYHALLHASKKNSYNEHLVNKLTARWLQDNFSGMFLHQALEKIGISQKAYKGRKYDSSRKHLKDYKERWG